MVETARRSRDASTAVDLPGSCVVQEVGGGELGGTSSSGNNSENQS